MSRARVLGALFALGCLAVGGCSSGSSGSAGSSDAGLCPSADALRSSVHDLRDVQVVADGTDAVRQAVSQVASDVNRLADAAQGEFSDQVSGLKSGVTDLGAAVDALGSAPSRAALSAVGTEVRALVEDAGVLVDDVSSSC